MSAVLALLLPGRDFRRQPALERARQAERILAGLERVLRSIKATPTYVGPLREMIAAASAREDIETGIRLWRLEMHRARKAARSAVAMGHGWPASASPAGAGIPPAQDVQSPYTPTAVRCPSEAL